MRQWLILFKSCNSNHGNVVFIFCLVSDALNPKDSGSKSSLLDDVDGKGKRSKAKDKKKDKKPSTTKPVTVKK